VNKSILDFDEYTALETPARLVWLFILGVQLLFDSNSCRALAAPF
jgi:hypothetical protein